MRFGKIFAIFFVILILCVSCEASESEIQNLIQSMTLREKVGQLFIIRPDHLNTTIPPEKIKDYVGEKRMSDLMIETFKQYPAGGFILFKKHMESPKQLKIFMKELKDVCKIPPIMAIDEEGGRIARIANNKAFNVEKYESIESIGKTGNPQNAFKAAETIGKYLKQYGFNLNFAPVADINTNPENIVIGDRSFGSDPKLVSEMSGAYLDGLHSQGIAGSLKHFPGHGDTKNDTHSGYVAAYKTWNELLKAELIPFIENFSKADSVMISHITMKNVTNDNLPATLSKELITGKLKNELGYNGLIITDSIGGMNAITDNYSSGEAVLLAFEAGNDIILDPYDYRESFNAILDAVKDGRISEQRLNESLEKILMLKSGFLRQ